MQGQFVMQDSFTPANFGGHVGYHSRDYSNKMDNTNSKMYTGQIHEGLKDVRVYRPPQQLLSGATYEGEWMNEERDGMGKQEWLDGSKYEGEWRNGKANG